MSYIWNIMFWLAEELYTGMFNLKLYELYTKVPRYHGTRKNGVLRASSIFFLLLLLHKNFELLRRSLQVLYTTYIYALSNNS